ncbi:unnamed protein product, partial [Nesidiocoris tenuis]
KDWILRRLAGQHHDGLRRRAFNARSAVMSGKSQGKLGFIGRGHHGLQGDLCPPLLTTRASGCVGCGCAECGTRCGIEGGGEESDDDGGDGDDMTKAYSPLGSRVVEAGTRTRFGCVVEAGLDPREGDDEGVDEGVVLGVKGTWPSAGRFSIQVLKCSTRRRLTLRSRPGNLPTSTTHSPHPALNLLTTDGSAAAARAEWCRCKVSTCFTVISKMSAFSNFECLAGCNKRKIEERTPHKIGNYGSTIGRRLPLRTRPVRDSQGGWARPRRLRNSSAYMDQNARALHGRWRWIAGRHHFRRHKRQRRIRATRTNLRAAEAASTFTLATRLNGRAAVGDDRAGGTLPDRAPLGMEGEPGAAGVRIPSTSRVRKT